MKHLLLILTIGFFTQFAMFSQLDFEVVDADIFEEDNQKTRSLFIWVPGVLTKGVSLFINKEEEPELKHTLRFLGGMKIRILEGNSDAAKWRRKTARWERKMNRKKLDDLMVVKSEDHTIHLKAGLPGNGKIKNYAFLINTDDTAIFLLGKSKLDLKKLMKLVEKVSS